MMRTTSMKIIGQDANGKNLCVCHFECDSAADLPAYNVYQSGGYVFAMSCTAHTIADNKRYEMQSDGTWVDMTNAPSTYDASDIIYDNTESGMTATNVQDAIEELNTDLSNATAEIKNITPTIIKDQSTSIGTSYTLISRLTQTTTAGKLCKISAIIAYRNYRPRGIVLSYSDDPSNFDTGDKLIAKTENTGDTFELSASAIISRNNVPVYVWAKAATAGAERIYSIMEQLGDL